MMLHTDCISVLCFQNDAQLHGSRVNILPFTPTRSVDLPCAGFRGTVKCPTPLCRKLSHRISAQSDKVNSTEKGLLRILIKLWTLLGRIFREVEIEKGR
jgi:hypothetical protein